VAAIAGSVDVVDVLAAALAGLAKAYPQAQGGCALVFEPGTCVALGPQGFRDVPIPAAAMTRLACVLQGYPAGHLADPPPESLQVALPVVAGKRGGSSRLLHFPLAFNGTRLGSLVLIFDGREAQEVDLGSGETLAMLAAMAVDRLRLRRGAEEADWLKTEVIASVSHQMRTPLASIKGYASALLLQGELYDEQTRAEFLRTIDEETDRLGRLIGDVLEAAAVEAGSFPVERQPVLLPRVVQATVSQFAQLYPSHRFLVSFPAGFPTVYADPERIEQVLHNLLDNAVKYSGENELVVVRGAVSTVEVTVSVADQGIGIAPEHLNRLFERFYRIRGSSPRRVPGAGLGLPIARSIVEAHGGTIWAESTPGKGSAFHFTLPLLDKGESEE
jgi:signal transduction histidine kinase